MSNPKKCNCLNASECPLDGKCLEKDVLYQGVASSNIANYKEKIYKGICATYFKSRYSTHKKAFANERYKNDTELSKELWKVRERHGTPKITWSILGKYSSYNPISKRCNLCLNEKLEIAIHISFNLSNRKQNNLIPSNYCQTLDILSITILYTVYMGRRPVWLLVGWQLAVQLHCSSSYINDNGSLT